MPHQGSISLTCLAFTHADPKSTKKTDGLTVYFALLESLWVKAAHRILVKSTWGGGREVVERGKTWNFKEKQWTLNLGTITAKCLL